MYFRLLLKNKVGVPLPKRLKTLKGFQWRHEDVSNSSPRTCVRLDRSVWDNDFSVLKSVRQTTSLEAFSKHTPELWVNLCSWFLGLHPLLPTDHLARIPNWLYGAGCKNSSYVIRTYRVLGAGTKTPMTLLAKSGGLNWECRSWLSFSQAPFSSFVD